MKKITLLSMRNDIQMALMQQDAQRDEHIAQQAEDWYNDTPKKEMIDYCLGCGVDLSDEEDERLLIEDWVEVAIECKAQILERACIS